MGNGAPPSGKGPSRAGTKQRPNDPVDPRTESVAGAEASSAAAANGNGNGNGSGLDAGGPGQVGNGDEQAVSPGQRLRRRLAASALLRPVREPAGVETDQGHASPSPSSSSDGTGPALLPPIRTTEEAGTPAIAGEPGLVASSSAPAAAAPAVAAPPVGVAPVVPAAVAPAAPAQIVGRHVPLAPSVKPASPQAAPSRVMPFVRPPVAPTLPASPETVPGELVAQKLAVPPAPDQVVDVPLDPDHTDQFAMPRVGRPSITFQRRRTRPRVRRVTRVVRHIDTWSVFKVALVFSAFIYAVALTAGVLLWHVAVATGTVDNVERFFEGFGWETFKFKGGEIYHNAWIAGLFVAIGLTGLAVLCATMFNLITDLVGGIRVSVLEEEVLARRDRTAKVVVEDDPDQGTPYDQARSG